MQLNANRVSSSDHFFVAGIDIQVCRVIWWVIFVIYMQRRSPHKLLEDICTQFTNDKNSIAGPRCACAPMLTRTKSVDCHRFNISLEEFLSTFIVAMTWFIHTNYACHTISCSDVVWVSSKKYVTGTPTRKILIIEQYREYILFPLRPIINTRNRRFAKKQKSTLRRYLGKVHREPSSNV